MSNLSLSSFVFLNCWLSFSSLSSIFFISSFDDIPLLDSSEILFEYSSFSVSICFVKLLISPSIFDVSLFVASIFSLISSIFSLKTFRSFEIMLDSLLVSSSENVFPQTGHVSPSFRLSLM